MQQGYFVTGTDTGVGKTWVTVALMCSLRRQKQIVVGMKPVASGCIAVDGQLKNSDALLLQQYSSIKPRYQQVNPYAYQLAVSPHLAGINDPAELPVIMESFKLLQGLADTVIVEGAGGWYSPLSQQMDNACLANALNLPVILVVAIRLGCINQARLSLQAIQQSSVICNGWVGVCVDPAMEAPQASIDFLTSSLNVPLLGVFPYLPHAPFEQLADYITLK